MKRQDTKGGLKAGREGGRLTQDGDKMLILRSWCQSGCFPYIKKKDNGLRFFFPRRSNLIKGTVKRRRSPTFLPARPLVCFCAHTWSSALFYLNALKTNLFLPHSKHLSTTSFFVFFVLFSPEDRTSEGLAGLAVRVWGELHRFQLHQTGKAGKLTEVCVTGKWKLFYTSCLLHCFFNYCTFFVLYFVPLLLLPP